MTAFEREEINPFVALTACLTGIEEQLATMNRRIAALERRPVHPPLAELEGLRQIVSDIEQTWANTGQLVDCVRALNTRVGEMGTQVELALVALPPRRRVALYRGRAVQQARRWAVTGD